MKKICVVLCSMMLLTGLLSCSKDSKDNSIDPLRPEGKVTAIGTVLNGTVARKTIGTAGGTLSSADGRITLEFPAGAVTENVEISITPITDENPMGAEKAYRLQPHGITFQKPVIIRFNYTDADVKSSAPELLGIAYQDENRVWQSRGGVLNKTQKTFTVTTTHFSDWSFYETCKIVPPTATVPVNGTVEMEVWSAAYFVPLAPGEEWPVGEVVDLTGTYVKKWKLVGAGRLTGNGAKGTYKAPSAVPTAPNPVAVSVELDFKQRGKFLLVAHITITDDESELEIAVGGGAATKRMASPVVKFAENLYGFGDADGDDVGSYVFVMWEGGVGSHAFKEPEQVLGTHAHYEIAGGASYTCFYATAEGRLQKSGGGVTITSMGEDDGYITGTFQANPAGIGPLLLSTTSFNGKFRVKRAF